MSMFGDIAAKIEMERLKAKIEEIKLLQISKDDALDMLKLYADDVIKDCESGYR